MPISSVSKGRVSKTEKKSGRKAVKKSGGRVMRSGVTTTTRKAAGKKKSVKKSPAKKVLAKKTPAKKNRVTTKSKVKKSALPVKSAGSSLSHEQLIDACRLMIRSRRIDEKIITLYKQNKCHFQIGCAGHEAIQVAVGAVFEAGKDWFYPYYRDMGVMVSLGMSAEEFMLNAMNKQDDPNSHGRQMPNHYGDKEKRVVNQSSPTGTQFTQAVGCALGAKLKGYDEVVYVSAGEGTCAQGDFHESINWAARDRLPVIFVIQNNGYAISVPVKEQLAGESVQQIASGYKNLHSVQIDGTDYEESYTTLKAAYERAKAGEGPTLIEAMVPRLQSHSISDNHLKYRKAEDIEAEKERCPIIQLRAQLLRSKLMSEKDFEALDLELKEEINKAAEWAEEQPDPSRADALKYTFSDPPAKNIPAEPIPSGEEVYMVDALNHALNEEMDFNPDMCIFGEDVAHGKGGVFTVTSGLTDRYGTDRVFNSQLAESSIIGVAIGLSTRGLKPVAEIQFGDYVWTGMMQIRNELAMMHYRSGGDFSCPAVIRIPVGGYIHGGAYHSQNIEATFSHFPGLYVVYPSNATDAKGLLKSSIRCHNPVLFLEHKGLYRQVYAKGAEGDAQHFTPLGKARIVKEGSDLTIVTYGAIVQKSLLAAAELDKEGVSAEVIDLRTIVPLDTETIFNSVRKTNRVLIAHEDVEFMGFGAEVAAQITEACFDALDAPVKRLGMKYAAAVPHSPALEQVVLPQTADVIEAARDLLKY